MGKRWLPGAEKRLRVGGGFEDWEESRGGAWGSCPEPRLGPDGWSQCHGSDSLETPETVRLVWSRFTGEYFPEQQQSKGSNTGE